MYRLGQEVVKLSKHSHEYVHRSDEWSSNSANIFNDPYESSWLDLNNESGHVAIAQSTARLREGL